MANENKKILIKADSSQGAVGEFFKNLGYELCFEYIQENQYEFIYGDFDLSETSIPRVKFEDDCSFLHDEHYLLKTDSDFFNNPIALNLIQDFFKNSYSFFKLENLKKKTILNLKLQDYLNLGFLLDTIIINGYKSKFSVLKLRVFLNEMCDVLFHKIDTSFNSTPIEINYFFDEESFKIQFEFGCHQFDIFKEEIIKKNITQMSNLSELTCLKRRERAIFKCVFFKDYKYNGIHAFSIKDLEEFQASHANDFEAKSTLEDHGNISFGELENDDFLEKISLGKEELDGLVYFLSSYQEEGDDDVMVRGSKGLADSLSQKVSDNSNMSLSELKLSAEKEFAADDQSRFVKLFDRLVENLKKEKEKKDKIASAERSETFRLKVSLQKSITAIKNKDALISKLRRDALLKNENQRQEIQNLDSKLKHLRIENHEFKEANPQGIASDATSAHRGENGEEDSSDALKLAQLEIKKLEQRLKFSTSQYDLLLKRKNTEMQGASKAEILRLKQNASILNAKVAELEKKLAYAEKRSA